MKLYSNRGIWCFSAEKIAYTTHHFNMTTVTSQLSIPRVLVRVSATRWQGDLEVPYYLRGKRGYEIMFLVALVCLSVCLFVSNITQDVMKGLQ